MMCHLPRFLIEHLKLSKYEVWGSILVNKYGCADGFWFFGGFFLPFASQKIWANNYISSLHIIIIISLRAFSPVVKINFHSTSTLRKPVKITRSTWRQQEFIPVRHMTGRTDWKPQHVPKNTHKMYKLNLLYYKEQMSSCMKNHLYQH